MCPLLRGCGEPAGRFDRYHRLVVVAVAIRRACTRAMTFRAAQPASINISGRISSFRIGNSFLRGDQQDSDRMTPLTTRRSTPKPVNVDHVNPYTTGKITPEMPRIPGDPVRRLGERGAELL